jgi:hypothetical protein
MQIDEGGAKSSRQGGGEGAGPGEEGAAEGHDALSRGRGGLSTCLSTSFSTGGLVHKGEAPEDPPGRPIHLETDRLFHRPGHCL